MWGRVCVRRDDDDGDDCDDGLRVRGRGGFVSGGEDGRGAIGGRKLPRTLTTSLVLFDRPPPACSYWSAFATVAVFSGVHRRRHNFLSTTTTTTTTTIFSSYSSSSSYPSADESTPPLQSHTTFLNRIRYYNFFFVGFLGILRRKSVYP